jgi:hypothetical protein
MPVAKPTARGSSGRRTFVDPDLSNLNNPSRIFTTRGDVGSRRFPDLLLKRLGLERSTLEALWQRPVRFRALLKRYEDALSEAQNSGQPVTFTVEVEPPADKAQAKEAKAVDGDAFDAALAVARERGAARIADILKAPDMLSARKFDDLIDLSHETVNQKRKSGEVLGLEGAKRGVRYPQWQVTANGGLLPGLKALSDAVDGETWTVYRLLVQHHGELGGATGLEALKARRLDEVLGVARNVAQGAFG